MAFEMGPETRQVQATWDVSAYKFKLDGRGMKILVEGMKDKKIRGIKCPECGSVYVPGPTFCRKCFIDIDDVVEVEDVGTIMSYAVEMTDVRGNPMEHWRVSAQIKMDGADSFLGGTIEVDDWHDVHIGQKVKAVWAENRVGALNDIEYFEPV